MNLKDDDAEVEYIVKHDGTVEDLDTLEFLVHWTGTSAREDRWLYYADIYNLKALDDYIPLHSDLSALNECPLCGSSYESKKGVMNHVKNKVCVREPLEPAAQPIIMQCPTCQIVFNSERRFCAHLLKDACKGPVSAAASVICVPVASDPKKRARKQSLSCDSCHVNVTSEVGLHLHRSRCPFIQETSVEVTPSEAVAEGIPELLPSVSCEACDKTFSSVRGLRRHLILHCPSHKAEALVEKPLQEEAVFERSCPACHRSFISQRALNTHRLKACKPLAAAGGIEGVADTPVEVPVSTSAFPIAQSLAYDTTGEFAHLVIFDILQGRMLQAKTGRGPRLSDLEQQLLNVFLTNKRVGGVECARGTTPVKDRITEAASEEGAIMVEEPTSKLPRLDGDASRQNDDKVRAMEERAHQNDDEVRAMEERALIKLREAMAARRLRQKESV